MTEIKNDERNVKELLIDLLEIADCNLLLSLINLEKDQVMKQIGKDVNYIGWIFGHLASHMDFIVGGLCQGKRFMSDKECTIYAYAAPKELVNKGLPTSFKDLVESYLKIRKNAFDYLNQLPEEKYQQLPEVNAGKESDETLIQSIERMALHYMGHMGQIILIRRAIDNPGFGFVAGIAKDHREKRIDQWMKWWEENKENFK
jgi:hypothetical protein